MSTTDELDDEIFIEDWHSNPMKRPYIAKVVVDICTGSGEALNRASTVLEQLTGQTPIQSRARQTVRDFGIRRREPIAVRVTLRNDRAEEFLSRALKAKENILLVKNWDQDGNFAFGIKEHIDIPDVKYDPELGVQGMNVTVCIERPGFRIKRRRRRRTKVFIKREFGVEILEKERERTYLF
jgi:large subunit ribosomal protein L5